MENIIIELNEDVLHNFLKNCDEEIIKKVKEIINNLSNNSRNIFITRYGLNGNKPIKEDLIARKFKMTLQEVTSSLARTKVKIKKEAGIEIKKVNTTNTSLKDVDLENILNKLRCDDKIKNIYEKRHGLNGQRKYSIKEIADILKIDINEVKGYITYVNLLIRKELEPGMGNEKFTIVNTKEEQIKSIINMIDDSLERTILNLVYNDKNISIKKIAKSLNISEDEVRKIIDSGLASINSKLNNASKSK